MPAALPFQPLSRPDTLSSAQTIDPFSTAPAAVSPVPSYSSLPCGTAHTQRTIPSPASRSDLSQSPSQIVSQITPRSFFPFHFLLLFFIDTRNQRPIERHRTYTPGQ